MRVTFFACLEWYLFCWNFILRHMVFSKFSIFIILQAEKYFKKLIFNITIYSSSNRISCPVNITSVREAEEYLSGELYKDLILYSSVSALGLFSPTMTTGK